MVSREFAAELERRIDLICDQFEQQLQTGTQPSIEYFLGKIPAVGRGRLTLELLRMAVEYAGPSPRRHPLPFNMIAPERACTTRQPLPRWNDGGFSPPQR